MLSPPLLPCSANVMLNYEDEGAPMSLKRNKTTSAEGVPNTCQSSDRSGFTEPSMTTCKALLWLRPSERPEGL